MRRRICVLLMALCMPLAVTSAGADDYTLGIFGDANMDETIDEDDIAYVEGIIYGTNEATELADANYDGNIDEDDITQIELIIVGEEEEIILIDMADRIVRVPRAIEKVVSTSLPCTRVIVALDGCDRLVGSEFSRTPGVPSISSTIGELAFACNGDILERVTNVGWGSDVNVELIVSLDPDVIIAGKTVNHDVLQQKTGIPVVAGRYDSYYGGPGFYNQIRLIGTVLGKEDEAEDLAMYMKEKIAEVTDITSEIPDSEKPIVYYAARDGGGMGGFTKTSYYDVIDLAGGINAAEECPTFDTYSEFDVSKEQIIEWNPDIILIKCHSINPPSETQITVDDVLSDPLLETVNAVKNGRVYYCSSTARGYPIQRYIQETMYFAKLFHPNEFKELNLEEEGNEIMKRFFGADGLYTWYAEETGWLRDYIESQEEG